MKNQQLTSPLNIEMKKRLISSAFWDYNISPGELIDILNSKKEENNYFTKSKIFLRLIERLSWYDIIDLIELENIKTLLTEELISHIKIPELKQRYDFIRKVLLGKNIFFTGWGDEYYQQIKYSLSSNLDKP